MDRSAFQSWLDRYVGAWRSNEAGDVRALFSEAATYRYHPWDDPLNGREAIVASWLEDPDAADSWEAEYRATAVEGDTAVATGVSRYMTDDRSAVDRTYHNVFVCRFDEDGRCSDFTEYFIEEKRR
jgi:hypothetical protein